MKKQTKPTKPQDEVTIDPSLDKYAQPEYALEKLKKIEAKLKRFKQ